MPVAAHPSIAASPAVDFDLSANSPSTVIPIPLPRILLRASPILLLRQATPSAAAPVEPDISVEKSWWTQLPAEVRYVPGKVRIPPLLRLRASL